jgi:hypothetical protein
MTIDGIELHTLVALPKGNRVGGWIDPRADLNVVAKREIVLETN